MVNSLPFRLWIALMASVALVVGCNKGGSVTAPQDQNPVAVAVADVTHAYTNQRVTFSGAGSYDPDGGAIVNYEWDWETDGVFDIEGPTAEHVWDTPGSPHIQLQVTDDEGATDTLDLLLAISIEEPVPFHPVDITPPWPEFEPEGLFRDGDYLYVAAGKTGLIILDITDPEMPVWVSYADTPGFARRVVVSEPYAYIADSGGDFVVVDVTDPSHPVWVAQLQLPGSSHSLAIDGNFAYIAARAAGLIILDISDPFAPTVVSMLQLPDESYDICIDGDLAYVAVYDAGMSIVDITSPETPVIVDTIEVPGYTQGIDISGSYAYLATGFYSSPLMSIIDISDPSAATVINTMPEGIGVEIDVEGSYAYLAGYPYITIVDISAPDVPSIVRQIEAPGSVQDVLFTQGYIYATNHDYGASYEDSLTVIESSFPPTATLVNNFDNPDSPYTIRIKDSYAYVTGKSNIVVLNIDGNHFPQIGNQVITSGHAYAVDASDTIACVADWTWLLTVLNINSPPDAVEIENLYYGLQSCLSRDVGMSGSYAFIASMSCGLAIVDISVPDAPLLLGFVDTPGYAYGVAVSGDYAYVADREAGLFVVDISDPAAAVLIGDAATLGRAMHVVVDGQYAYIADGDAGVTIMDVSDPSAPLVTGNVVTSDEAGRLRKSGSYVYVADGAAGLTIVDVSDPSAPSIVTNLSMHGFASDVDLSGEFAYVTSEDSGIRVIQLWDPIL